MITIRPSKERGHANYGWLNTYHTFSFANYYDPNYLGFRNLRVINEDYVSPGQGFDTHGHRDMEIITYVLEGTLEHKDSLGNGSIILPGEIQRMSAGTGIRHSEFNPSQTESVHLLQIWILPNQTGIEPSYEQHDFTQEKNGEKLHLIAAPDDKKAIVNIHQDVNLYAGMLESGDTLFYTLKPQRHAWIQIARGSIELNGISLTSGDGAAISDEQELTIKTNEKAEILLFDLN